MTRALAALLVVSIPAASLAVPAPASAASTALAEPSPEELYEQGRKAYRVGKFKEAVDAWERSFAASDNSLLLYNISLAYRGLYGITGDIEDLKRARAVLDNFIRVAEADPALASEIGDAQTRITEIDAELEAARAKQAAIKPVPTDKSDAGPSKAELARARKLRLGGAIAMGTGGALLITGAALGAFYSIKGRDYSNLVRQNKQAATNLLRDLSSAQINNCLSTGVTQKAEQILHDIHGLPAGDPRVAAGKAMLDECAPAINPLGAVSTYRRNGGQANTGAIVSFAVVGGLGLVAIITGAVLFAQGNRLRSKRVADLRLSPVLGGRSMTGFSLTGRF
jgi:tetratricopeptide (TPR) repeat protein